MYLSIFTRTAGGLALTALVAAQALDWSNRDTFISSATLLSFGLLAALISGLIAVGWAFVTSPAKTALGKAWRAATQALLASPLAAVVIASSDDVVTVQKLLLPTVSAVVLAFVISYMANRVPAPASEVPPLGADFLGTSG